MCVHWFLSPRRSKVVLICAKNSSGANLAKNASAPVTSFFPRPLPWRSSETETWEMEVTNLSENLDSGCCLRSSNALLISTPSVPWVRNVVSGSVSVRDPDGGANWVQISR